MKKVSIAIAALLTLTNVSALFKKRNLAEQGLNQKAIGISSLEA